ncbi:MAG: hypothetical protein ABIN89_25955 [Chitinophagaceae bacterium]
MKYISRAKSYKNPFIVFLMLVFLNDEVSAQSVGKAIVKGRVLDSLSANPLGLANIQLFTSPGKKLVSGVLAKEDGTFFIEIGLGRYYAVVISWDMHLIKPKKLFY